MPRILDPEGAHLAALRRLGAFAGRRVLEFGYGDGRLTLGIAADAGSVFPFDADANADAEAVERARRSLPAELAERVAFGVATAQEIQLESRSFDLARGVERELVAGVEVDDAHMVAQRIEATDLLPATLTLHQKAETRKG
jgi:tRNA A58 N-methylase Trm61